MNGGRIVFLYTNFNARKVHTTSEIQIVKSRRPFLCLRHALPLVRFFSIFNNKHFIIYYYSCDSQKQRERERERERVFGFGFGFGGSRRSRA